MYIKKNYGFTALKNNSWAGAVVTLKAIEEAGKEEELMDLLGELFNAETPPGETEVNDFLWFETDYIYESLGIKEEEEED
jgi:phage-related protein